MTSAAPAVEGARLERAKLVVRGLYDAQKLRIQAQLRTARLVRDGLMGEEEARTFFKVPFDHLQKAEAAMERMVWTEIKDLPIVDLYLAKVKGIGPRLAGLLVANIAPIGRFETISKLWAYAGLHVKDGRAPRRAKGAKANWNAELKVTCWKAAESFVKQAEGAYRRLYDAYKARIIEREVALGRVIWASGPNGAAAKPLHWDPAKATPPAKPPEKPEWTAGRVNAMALRYIAKRLLAHLWLVWRTMEDLPVRAPYAIEHQGHTSADDPWDYVE